jgi:hypothetical protein
MARNHTIVPALALGAVLATAGLTAAQDGTPARPELGTTMTLGGKGTPAQAAAADDTELTWCCRKRYYGCWGGGCGYGWGCGYGVSYYSYAPVYYAPPVCYRPYPAYYNGFGYGGFGYNGFSYGGYRGYRGFYVGVNGTEADTSAPAVSLNLAVANNPVVPTRTDTSGGFRYDGGPANPVPLPKPDATPTTKATPATGLPVSLPKTKPASPYTYKAYGEK